MTSRTGIWGFLLLMLSCSLSHAGSEVLFERKMTPQEKEQFTFTTGTKPVSVYSTVEQVKREYILFGHSKWNAKLVVWTDEETGKPIALELTHRRAKPVATVYRRELSKDDVEKYELIVRGS